MARSLTRRDVVQLGGVAVIGWGAAQLFQRAAPLGRDVRTNMTAQSLVHDRVSPRRDVPGADLTMVVFTDYQCPACKRAAPAMDAAVAEDGRVRVIYKDWPIFGPQSERAASVALAAVPQGIYLDLHRRLMAERRRLADAVLQANVEAAGGDWQRLAADLGANDRAIRLRLARTSGDAFALGIPGTPAYLIGTLLVVGGLDEAEFRRAFAEARKASSRLSQSAASFHE